MISALRPLSTGQLLLPIPPIPGGEEAITAAHQYPVKTVGWGGMGGREEDFDID